MISTKEHEYIQILLIGDDPNILRTIRRNLVSRGYRVSIALDDQESYMLVSQIHPHLCILIMDFTTINLDGIQVCQRLRELTPNPIIVLSALGMPKMEVQALDHGADDYITMPFGMQEFLARVRSALRRSSLMDAGDSAKNRVIVVGDLMIDTEYRLVIVRGEETHFTPTEYNLLVYLAQRAGKMITHRELLREIWGGEYGDEREYLRVYISQIRQKIELDPLRPKYIVTEPGVGYRLRE